MAVRSKKPIAWLKVLALLGGGLLIVISQGKQVRILWERNVVMRSITRNLDTNVTTDPLPQPIFEQLESLSKQSDERSVFWFNYWQLVGNETFAPPEELFQRYDYDYWFLLHAQRINEGYMGRADALVLLDHVVNSRSSNIYHTKGELLRHAEDIEEAIETFELALKLENYDERLQTLDYELALVYNIRFSSSKALTLLRLNQLYLNQGNYDKAIEFADLFQKEEPELAIGFYLKGLSYFSQAVLENSEAIKQAQLLEAKSLLDEGLKNEPEHYISLVLAGRIARELESFDEAELFFSRAIAIYPNDLSGQLDMGNLLFMLQRYDEALVHYQIAHDLAPENPTVKVKLGDVYASLEDMEKAIILYNEALQILPESTYIMERLLILEGDE